MTDLPTNPSQQLLDAFIETGTEILIVTGAGISRASGIQTFRGSDPGAIWNVHDLEMATRGMLERDPVGHWRWYLDRFATVDSAQPNPAHFALVEMERWARQRSQAFTVVTQNIDPLHERAGSQELIKVHGTASRLRCSARSCSRAAPAGSIDRAQIDLASFRTKPSQETLPHCPECSSVLRPHVLFFDEYYDSHLDYRIDQVLECARAANLIMFVGTSFSVGITDMLIRAGWDSKAQMFSIDPHAPPPPGSRIIHLSNPAEVLLSSLADQLDSSTQDRTNSQ